MGPQFQAQSPCTNSLCSGYFFFELSIRNCKINPAMFKNCNPAPVSAYSVIWKCLSHLTSPRHLAHGFGVWTPRAISYPPMNVMACSITWLSISIGPSTSDFPEICIISSKIVIIHSPRCGQWDPRASLAWAFAIAFFCCFSTYASVLVPCARMRLSSSQNDSGQLKMDITTRELAFTDLALIMMICWYYVIVARVYIPTVAHGEHQQVKVRSSLG